MSSSEWKGEILLEEDAWPGMEEDEDVEVYNITHQPRKWSSCSMACPNTSSPYGFRQGRLSLPAIQFGSSGRDRDLPPPPKRSDSEGGSPPRDSRSGAMRSHRSASSLYADLMVHLRPRSTSPLPRSRSPSAGDIGKVAERSTHRSRNSSKTASGDGAARLRSRSYHGEHRIEVPVEVLVDIAG